MPFFQEWPQLRCAFQSILCQNLFTFTFYAKCALRFRTEVDLLPLFTIVIKVYIHMCFEQ